MAELRHKHFSALILITFLVYSTASSTIFQTFVCDDLDDGFSYLRADYRLRCHRHSGASNMRHLAYMVYAGIMILIYPLGIPAMYTFALYTGKTLHSRRPRMVQSPIGLSFRPSFVASDRRIAPLQRQEAFREVHSIMDSHLCRHYRKERFYYEIIECVRRVTLTGIVVFMFPGRVVQIVIMLPLALAFFAVSETLDPYSAPFNRWMARLGHMTVIVSIFVALLLDFESSTETVSEEHFLSSLLVIGNVVMAIGVLGETVLTMLSSLQAES